jgi:SPP1 gp7 family putative phage head morphogenesis protein
MTPQEFAKLQREFLISAEKRSAVFLHAEFERIKREIIEYLLLKITGKPTLVRLGFIDDFIDLLIRKIDLLSSPAGQIIARSQNNVVRFASDSLKKYLNFRLESSIFSPDREAIRILIGRAFEGESLQTVFNRMKPAVANRARVELIEGFALGESNEAIAKRIPDVTDLGRYRALTIARNETLMSYKNASTEFYAEAGIKQYRFISSLDPRCCLVCWRLHGTKWKLKEKPHIHVGCRCVVLPVLKGEKIKTGVELFSSLESGYQKQILGPKRFSLFGAAGNSIDSFVGVDKSKEFGRTFYVKNLSDLPDTN